MGAKQTDPFDPRRAASLDDPQRERWFPKDAVLRLVEVPPGARVLDYGTGTGRYAIEVARAYPDASVEAFDSQERMLSIARERVRESKVQNLVLLGPNVAALGGGFDRVMVLNVLHEIEDRDLQKIRELLKPDGFALFIDWDAAIPRDFGPPAHHTHTVEDARRRLTSTGFEPTLVSEPDFPYHHVIRARCHPKVSKDPGDDASGC